MSRLAALGAAALVALGASRVRAEEPQELRYDLRLDVPISVVAGVLLVGTEAGKKSFAPAGCRWCDRAADGTDTLNGLDRSVRSGLKWSNTSAADTASSVTGFGLAPVAALGLTTLAAGHDGRLREAPADALLIVEATLVSMSVNQLVKFAAGRERPFVHALAPQDKAGTAHPDDNNLSFYSGHTDLAFSLAVSSGTVASMRGYRLAPLVWAGGLAVAGVTGYLRIAADKHYFTDVVTGAAAGSLIGFAFPFFLHPRASSASAPSIAPVVTGSSLGVGGTW